MSERLTRDHGLGPFLASAPVAKGHDYGLSIQILPEPGHINLRGNADNPEFVTAVTSVLGQGLPVDANTMSIENHHVYWLGPDEWLIVTPHKNIGNLLIRLRDRHGPNEAVTDISGGNIVLRLSGRGARDVLAKGCTLDFHPASFQISMCAQSGLAKANVLIGLVAPQPVYEIVVRRSFSDYLLLWLQAAGREFGIECAII